MYLRGEPPQLGEVVAERFAIERVLGHGGMGLVVAARHLELGVLVALKFPLPELANHPERCARFVREARAAIQIRSEHVARVMDLSKLADGTPFIVMEYLEGATLSDILSERGPLPVGEAIGILLQACDALAEAHAIGIVHRDLKPSNMSLCHKSGGGTILKVMDFGISKVQAEMGDGGDVSITKTGGLVGSPAYMSPEQICDSKNVDARTDVWSLGIILFEMLTARRPFDNHSVGGLLSAIASARAVGFERRVADRASRAPRTRGARALQRT